MKYSFGTVIRIMKDKEMLIARSGNSRNYLKREKTIIERTILLKA